MKPLGARTGRRTLASTSCLLLLAGLSCKYNVTLPWIAEGDASPRVPDTSFDHSPLSSPDTPLPTPDTRGCLGNYEIFAHSIPLQIIVAIDRSMSMLKEFDSFPTKAQAAWAALSASSSSHTGISFVPIWFPWTNCGTSCCASTPYSPTGRGGSPDASYSCGPFEIGCLSSSKDSPSHQALQKAFTATKVTWTSTVVLITDQNPSCAGDSPDINECEAASNSLSDLGSQPTRTYVLVPNTDGDIPDCFSRITKQSSRDFYAPQVSPARNSQDLATQLEAIVTESEKGLCRFYLRDANLPDVDQVRIGSAVIPREGWQINNGAIELTSEYCKNTNGQEVKARVCNPGYGPAWP
jgi:hypothetical protein